MTDQSTDDPFLCQECQLGGYCKKQRMEEVVAYTINEDIIHRLDDALPIHSTAKHSDLKIKLQACHDFLREKDYESAFLHYRALLQEGYNHWEAYLGLAICCYYQGEYEDAVRYAEQINLIDRGLTAFTELCLYRLEARAIVGKNERNMCSIPKEITTLSDR